MFRMHVFAWGHAFWCWWRVLWVCRVPLLSAVAGGGLLAGTVQARDWFADLGPSTVQWFFFFALVFVWAWVVHASARGALQHDDWVPEAHVRGALTPSRRAELQHEFKWPALVVPRFLGFAVFFFVGWAVCRTRRNLLDATAGLPEADAAVVLSIRLLIAVTILSIVFMLFVWKRRRLPVMFSSLAPFWTPIQAPVLAGTAPIFASKSGAETTLIVTPRATPVDRALSVARLLILLALAAIIIDPHLVASQLPRLFFAPLLFAGFVLLLGEVAAWSHRIRTPLLLLLLALSVGLLYLVDHFHDVRWLSARAPISTPAGGSSRQIAMAEAVQRWMVINDCNASQARPCPRPILIAGAGGASRAAFFTATIVGALMDLGSNSEHRATYGNLRNRIFAMSTVSGGSVGGAIIRAAMADAADGPNPDRPPCRTSGSGSWFGTKRREHDPFAPYDATKSWRDCFQSILAGDFLSPIVVGLTYRDNFPLTNPITLEPLWADRATLLEQGFERRYHRMMTIQSARVCKDLPNTDPAEKHDASGLCRRFGYHPDPAAAKAWLPLLFMNVTSVSTGRRIIIADVPIGKEYAAGKILLPFAYDLYELRDHPTQKHPIDPKGVDDVRLSTAAAMSARFPIISPHGLVRHQTGRWVVDRVVDGGYFENGGLATIADIAAILRDEYRLQPVVFRVTNEPTETFPEERQLGKDRPPAPDDAERTPFDDVTSVFRTLTATRSGHEDGHAAYLRSVIGDDRLYEIGVYPLDPDDRAAGSYKQMTKPHENPLCRRTVPQRASMGQVSMSWWMSQPVQAYLDAQLCVRANWERLECELREGRSSAGAPCPARSSILRPASAQSTPRLR